jgi:hypothetical protein
LVFFCAFQTRDGTLQRKRERERESDVLVMIEKKERQKSLRRWNKSNKSPEVGENEEGNHQGDERDSQAGQFQYSRSLRHYQFVLFC